MLFFFLFRWLSLLQIILLIVNFYGSQHMLAYYCLHMHILVKFNIGSCCLLMMYAGGKSD